MGELAAGRATFTLTCALDAKVFDRPLTVVIPAADATEAKALRDGTPVLLTVKPDGILVDVVPSASPVTVTWTQGKPGRR